MTATVEAGARVEVPAHWRSWTAENLALGVPRQQVVEALREAGLPGEAVEAEVARALDDPYVAAAVRIGRRYGWAESLLELYSELRDKAGQHTLPRVTGARPEEFFGYYYANRPAVFAGVADQWPARQWTPANLRQRFGAVEVEVMTGRDANPEHAWQHDAHRARMSFGEYLTMVESGGETNDYYMVPRNENWQNGLGGMVSDVRAIPGVVDPRLLPETLTLLLGPAGTVTPLHHDNMNILLCQVVGRKLIRLVPSYQRHLVYPRGGTYSHVDAGNPDLESHPLYADATVLEAVLESGDAVLIPAGWWHWVKAREVSVNVSFHHFAVPGGNHYLHPPRAA
ncbi:cupin-like domain-containing protein [Phytohabitans kaempferiae]|uniref:Cupin-like domain-containing protein n=1 Tax=Phytohabitans kaempferiae TaxID=1620943 RepID=A0ABV6MDB7_9ACTN